MTMARITKEERELIDAALAEGRVTKVPRGASAWQIIEGVTLSPNIRGLGRDKVLAFIERRQKIRAMVEEGWTDNRIIGAFRTGERLGASTIMKDIRYIRYTIEPELRTQRPPYVAKMQELRRDKVKAGVEKGWTVTEIARSIGSTTTTVRADCKWLKLEPALGYKGKGRRV